MTPHPLIASRDRAADMNALADFILQNLFTWTMSADWGVDFGFRCGSYTNKDGTRGDERAYLSAGEIIVAVLGIELSDDEDDYPPELCEYVRELFVDVGALLRARGHLGPIGKGS